MRMVVRKIMAIANDERVSDKHFRNILRNLTREDLRRSGVLKSLDVLTEEAVYETERDKFVH